MEKNFKLLKLGLSRLKKKKEEREEGNKRGRGDPGGVAYLRAREVNRGIPRLLGACCYAIAISLGQLKIFRY